MSRKQLLEKIRKCLALAASANEHEAAAALAKARALMEEHGVDQDDVAMAEVEEAAARGSRAQRPALWETILCNGVCIALDVTSFIDLARDRRFIGRGASPEIAAYAFKVLFRHLQRARAEYIAKELKRCKLARKRARADAFCEGWVRAVQRAMTALAPEHRDDPLVDQYLAVHHPGLVEVKARAAKIDGKTSNDYWNGIARGRSVDLNKGVGVGLAPKAIAA
ncbi:MAG: DUF2786 domain-containing protein [Sphingomonas sp.]